jgi:HK97 family phage prohead protease
MQGKSQEGKYINMSNKLERRFCKSTLRASEEDDDDDDDLLFLDGYAATFRSLSNDLGGYKERLSPGCFSRALSERQDVRCLRNHNPDFVLGRTKNGTLLLAEDSTGLNFRCMLDRNNPEHVAMHASVKRGDIDSMSFAFVQKDQSWADEKDQNGEDCLVRTLKDCDLRDVSPVCYPAYQATSVSARMSLQFPEGVPDGFEMRSTGVIVPIGYVDKDSERRRAILRNAQNLLM